MLDLDSIEASDGIALNIRYMHLSRERGAIRRPRFGGSKTVCPPPIANLSNLFYLF